MCAQLQPPPMNVRGEKRRRRALKFDGGPRKVWEPLSLRKWSNKPHQRSVRDTYLLSGAFSNSPEIGRRRRSGVFSPKRFRRMKGLPLEAVESSVANFMPACVFTFLLSYFKPIGYTHFAENSLRLRLLFFYRLLKFVLCNQFYILRYYFFNLTDNLLTSHTYKYLKFAPVFKI